jgi:hypothetical protein
MNNKDLIIQILRQDLRYNQLLLGLESLEIDLRDHYDITCNRIVSNLMGISDDSVPEQWWDLYTKLMEESINEPISKEGDAMLRMAEYCYAKLLSFVEINKVLQSD